MNPDKLKQWDYQVGGITMCLAYMFTSLISGIQFEWWHFFIGIGYMLVIGIIDNIILGD